MVIANNAVSKAQMAVRALSMRKAGKSYDDIARDLKVSHATAFRLVQNELRKLNAKRSSTAEEILRLEIERCYEIIQSLWPRRNEPRTAEVILKTVERISKFYGLDKPLRIEQAISVEDMSYEQLIAEAERIGLKTVSSSAFEIQNALPGLNVSNLTFLPDKKETEKLVEPNKEENNN